MSGEKTEAIVIRQTDFSETSRVISLFTRDFGKISALAKGAKRLKGPFEAALDLLARCRIVFLRKSSGGLDLLTEAQLVKRFRATDRNLVRLYGGYYVAELLASLTEEHDPHPALYDETVEALDRLENHDPKLAILRFELATLREIGHFPELETCVACGRNLDQNGPFAFWVSQGGLICRSCQKQEYSNETIHIGTLAVLKRLATDDVSALSRLVVSPAQIQEIRHITLAAITHLLGKRPKMERYLGF